MVQPGLCCQCLELPALKLRKAFLSNITNTHGCLYSDDNIDISSIVPNSNPDAYQISRDCVALARTIKFYWWPCMNQQHAASQMSL